MIDINLIRENRELVKENIKKKFQDEKLPLVDEIYELDVRFREAKSNADNLRSEKNKLSDKIGSLMREDKKDDAAQVRIDISKIDDDITEYEKIEVGLEELIKTKMLDIPQIIDDSVPIGKDSNW